MKRATLERPRDLPSALVTVDENDVLGDYGKAFAHKVINAAVELTAARMVSLIYGFMILNGKAQRRLHAKQFRFFRE